MNFQYLIFRICGRFDLQLCIDIVYAVLKLSNFIFATMSTQIRGGSQTEKQASMIKSTQNFELEKTTHPLWGF